MIVTINKRELLEKVQRRFTKLLQSLKHLKYSIRLTRLGLPCLELRRLHLDLLYCYKIVFGLICLDVNKYFIFTSLSTRGHPYKLYKTQCENLKRRSFFTELIVMYGIHCLLRSTSRHCLGSNVLSHKSISHSS